MFESASPWQVILSLVLLCSAVWAAERILHFWQKARELDATYRSQFLFLDAFVTQDVVDFRLRQLAAEFEKAVERQGEALKSPDETVSIGAAAYDVEQTKKKFWDAHAGVKRWTEFKVHDSIKAYIPQRRLHSA